MNPSYDNNFGSLNPGGLTQPGNSPEPLTPQSFRPVSSSQGDIILATQSPKRSKKWLIAIGVILLTLVLVLIAFLLINQSKNQDANDFKKSFNNYANYIINGEISDNDLKDNFSFDEQYALERILASDDKEDIRVWLQEADRLLQVVKSNYDNFKEQSVMLSTYINSSKNALDFLILRTSVVELTDDELLELYRTNGYDSTVQRIDQRYNAYIKSESPYANRYGEDLSVYAKDAVDIFKLAQDANCDVASMEQVRSCSYPEQLANSYSEKNTQKDEYYYMAELEYREAYISLERFCWNIRDELDIKTDMNDVLGGENE